MPWKTFDTEAAFYRFLGHAGSTIPISQLPQSARDAMRERQQEQDPDEQAHEQHKDHK